VGSPKARYLASRSFGAEKPEVFEGDLLGIAEEREKDPTNVLPVTAPYGSHRGARQLLLVVLHVDLLESDVVR
jgi:hypothetical protein